MTCGQILPMAGKSSLILLPDELYFYQLQYVMQTSYISISCNTWCRRAIFLSAAIRNADERCITQLPRRMLYYSAPETNAVLLSSRYERCITQLPICIAQLLRRALHYLAPDMNAALLSTRDERAILGLNASSDVATYFTCLRQSNRLHKKLCVRG